MFLTNIIDHGGHRGNVMRALAQWRHPVASSEIQDVLHRAMRPASHHRIRMAIKITNIWRVFLVPSTPFIFAPIVRVHPTALTVRVHEVRQPIRVRSQGGWVRNGIKVDLFCGKYMTICITSVRCYKGVLMLVWVNKNGEISDRMVKVMRYKRM